MAEVVWTRWAADELNDIAEFISLDNPDAAGKLVRAAWELTQRLSSNPKMGKPLKALPGFSYRELILTPLRIFYRQEGDTIYIIHIIRHEQYLHLDILVSR